MMASACVQGHAIRALLLMQIPAIAACLHQHLHHRHQLLQQQSQQLQMPNHTPRQYHGVSRHANLVMSCRLVHANATQMNQCRQLHASQSQSQRQKILQSNCAKSHVIQDRCQTQTHVNVEYQHRVTALISTLLLPQLPQKQP